jgi:flagellar hook-associated protein 2
LRFASTATSVSAESANEDIVGVRASSTAETGSFNIEVAQLAQAHALSTDTSFESVSTAIGTGTLSFDFPGNDDLGTTAITIDSSNNTLEGIRDAVNSADMGVKASIIDVGGGSYKLQFVSEDSGADNEMKITASGDAALDVFAYDADNPVAGDMNEDLGAQDAQIKYNGLTINRATNNISDVVSGVTLTLKGLSDAGVGTEITISQDDAALGEKISAFVASFNELKGVLNELVKYDVSSGTAGALQGDAVVRRAASEISNVLNQEIPSIDGGFNNLIDIGISTQADGTLAINAETLATAIAQDSAAVARLFSIGGDTGGNDLKFIGVTNDSQSGIYRVNISQNATQGSFTGSTLGGSIVVGSGDDSLFLEVDGLSANVSLTQDTYTGADFAAHLQAQINGNNTFRESGVSVNVDFTDNQLVITSASYGSSSEVNIVSTNAALGLTEGNGTAGLNIAGTINGEVATGAGRFLTGSIGSSKGVSLEYRGNETGAVGRVSVSRGYADKFYGLIEALLDSDGSIESRSAGLQSSIDNITEQREELAERLATLEERYRAQFVAMDTLVASLQQTGDFLTRQLEALPTIGSNKK